MSVIEIEDLTKTYQMGEMEVHALRGLDLEIRRGEWVAIMGPSGSGKSTLMNIIGCLDTPSSGVYRLSGVKVDGMTDDQLADIRNQRIGFVFQTFNLLPRTSALKQVMLPMQYSQNGHRPTMAERERRAQEALETVDEINHPDIILADEPTGNLDSSSGGEVMEMFHKLHEQRGITMIMVTHDETIGAQAGRVIRLLDGAVMSGGRRSSHELRRSLTHIPTEEVIA